MTITGFFKCQKQTVQDSVKYLPFLIWCIIADCLQTADASIPNWPQEDGNVQYLLLFSTSTSGISSKFWSIDLKLWIFDSGRNFQKKMDVLWLYTCSKNPFQDWGWWPRYLSILYVVLSKYVESSHFSLVLTILLWSDIINNMWWIYLW